MSSHTPIILCVDDDPDDRMFVCESIKEANASFQIVEAHNGVQALELLEKAKTLDHIPCLIVLDINMPLMDGKKTLTEIKKDQKLSSVPVVMFTTSSSRIDQTFCNFHGVEMFTKPSTATELSAIVKKLIRYCTDENN